MKLNFNFYKGLRFKMTLVFSVVFMLINAGFNHYTYQYFQKSYIDNYNKYLLSRASILLNRTEINPDIIALPDTGESVRYFYKDDEQRKKIVFQSPGTISRISVPYKSGVIDTLNLHGVYLTKESADGRVIELLLTVSNISLQKKLNFLSDLMLISTLAGIAISAIAVYFLSGWLLGPVRQIIYEATQINTAKLNTRLKVNHTHDELQQLTETINNMLGRIEHEQTIQNNFFAAASHELRTPLAVLKAETELHLQDQLKPDFNLMLQNQLTEIDRLQHVVQQFLLISELKHKGLQLVISEVDLSEQLLKVFVRNQSLIQHQGLQTAILFDEQAPSYLVKGDKDKLEIVWQNLLLNAIKYSVPGTKVTCFAGLEGDFITVTLINKTLQESIATQGLGSAFFQTNLSNTSGSGLGLWLCREIINLHNGEITFSSKDYTFSVFVKLKLS